MSDIGRQTGMLERGRLTGVVALIAVLALGACADSGNNPARELGHEFSFQGNPLELNLAPGEVAVVTLDASCADNSFVSVGVGGVDLTQVRLDVASILCNHPGDANNTFYVGTSALRVTALPTAAIGTQRIRVTGTHRGHEKSFALDIAIGPRHTLDVSVNGAGRINSNPPGIDCGATCSATLPHLTTVTLTATPDAGQALAAWNGCDSEAGATCTLALNADRAVNATFAGQVPLSVTLVGQGSVTSSPTGIDCGAHCVESYLAGTAVTLTATPASGHVFSGWSGDCSGANAAAGVVLSTAKSCVAAFVPVGSPPTSGWQAGGPVLAGGSSDARTVSVAVDATDPLAPIIFTATTVFNGSRMDLIVQRYDGVSLTLVGGGPINPSNLPSSQEFTPAITLVDRAPVVAWSENEQRVLVKRWNGTSWLTLSDNLSLDPALPVFGAQLTTFGRELIVAWLERDVARTTSRMAVKRYDPVTQQWSGGLVLPTETNVSAIRLATETSGAALLMFVTYSPASASLEAPLRVVRQGMGNTWTDVCSANLTPAPPSAAILQPNTLAGFGITRSAVTAEPVAVFTNGEAVFVQACRDGVWKGLDGSAQGRVTASLVLGESLSTLSVAQAEGSGAVLVWSKLAFFGAAGFGFSAQVMVENSTATAMLESGTALSFQNDVGLALRSLSLGFAAAGTPVLATMTFDASRNNYVARTFRYVP